MNFNIMGLFLLQLMCKVEIHYRIYCNIMTISNDIIYIFNTNTKRDLFWFNF